MTRFVERLLIVTAVVACMAAEPLTADELLVGRATVSITPERPVPLSGQMRTRISTAVESPVTATALALESRGGERSLDQAILVSCDLVAIREGVIEEVRERLKDRLPGCELQKLVLSATHTHTAPEVIEGRYEIPTEGVMRPEEYRAFLVEQLAGVVEQAWSSRAKGKVGWGLGHAVVAQNRLAVYSDGHAQMYGPTDRPDFARFEGYEDHGLEVLFFWDADDRLIATAINLACPAQEVEGRSTVNADFWHVVREMLHDRHGEHLAVLAWTGAAGDQSPHLMIRKQAEERMRRLRKLDRLEEIARRVVAAWQEALEGAQQEKHADAVLKHHVETLSLPVRLVTQEEALAARQKAADLAGDANARRRMLWHQEVVARFERQKSDDVYAVELHVIRLGDVAIATNPFELYTDYGIQMKAGSRALQTFVIQLAGRGTYLPAERSLAGGAYGAIVQSNAVGPAGGRILTEGTIAAINSLWPEAP